MADHAAPTAGAPLAQELFATALLRGSFTLRSGATSDRYFDKYRVTCDPTLLRLVSAELARRIDGLEGRIDRVVAPELGAVPLAAGIAMQGGAPYAIVRGAGKAYGTGNRIEGPFAPGDRAVLVEDVVTSGGAALEAIEVARAAGIEVVASICVLDRDGGGREALAAIGAPLVSLLDAADLDAAYDAGIGTPA